MKYTEKVIFIRNDDVRDKLDESLVRLTGICLKHGVPISHAVEPGNVTVEVANWLILQKKQNPALIEIIQHGYNHNLDNPGLKMEFGGSRTYEDQLTDIREGKRIMNELFGSYWTPVFTFPYGTYNQATLRAVDDAGYPAISSRMQFSAKVRLKNSIGKFLGKDLLLGKKINYHPDQRKGYNFREISVSANLIRKYTGFDQAEHYSAEEILQQIKLASEYTNIIGLLLHHRFHGNHLEMVDQIIPELKAAGYRFSSLNGILSMQTHML